jgi:regulator of protease activity HflC (stomatin/prohibitin superfamily)
MEGIDPVEVDEFNLIAGRLFKWLKIAVDNRKADIIRRRAIIHKEREERDSKIKAKQEREAKRQHDLKEAQDKFAEENKDEIEAYNNYMKIKEGGGDDYNDEEEEEVDDKNKEPPKLPLFNQEEFFAKFDEEFPEIVILPSTDNDIDNDWVLPEEEFDLEVQKFWTARTES